MNNMNTRRIFMRKLRQATAAVAKTNGPMRMAECRTAIEAWFRTNAVEFSAMYSDYADRKRWRYEMEEAAKAAKDSVKAS
jgi:protein subunit release factor A